MASAIGQVKPLTLENRLEHAEAGEGLRQARARLLDELPGLAICAAALFCIVRGFAALMF